MFTGDLAYWLSWIGVIVLYSVMIYVAWRALFGDKRRGTRRCPKCWHDLSHTPGMTCSECGFAAQSERELHRTRRRLSVAAAAILICVVAAVVINERMTQRGWMGVMPTKALIWTLPLTIEDSGSAVQELGRRMSRDELSAGEWLMIIERCAEGDRWRRPVSDDWESTYGSLLNSWRGRLSLGVSAANVVGPQGIADSEAMRFQQRVNELLLSIPPKVEATTRESWPAGAAPRVDIALRDWGPRDSAERLRIKVAGEDESTERVAYRASDFRPNIPFSFQAPPVQPNQTAIVLDVAVERRVDPRVDDWKSIARKRFSLPITVTEQTAMQPVRSEELNLAMQHTFDRGIVKWVGGPSPVRFRVMVPATAQPEFDGVAIGAVVELRREGELARRLDLWWLAGVLNDNRYNFEIVHEDLELLKLLGADEAEWSLTVRGDHDVALRAGPAEQYWAGSVDVPFTLIRPQTNSPQRPWWTDQQLREEQAGEYSKLE